jgi:hypothetical protein
MPVWRLTPIGVAIVVLAFAREGAAAVFNVEFNSLGGSATIATPLENGDEVRVTGLVQNDVGFFGHPVNFTAGMTGRGLSAVLLTREGGAFDIDGVDLDLTDSEGIGLGRTTSSNQPGLSVVTLTFAGLAPGESYQVLVTGEVVTTGSYTLTLTVTPIPAPAALLGTGLAALVLAARRRR